jgi:hypothetical protein
VKNLIFRPHSLFIVFKPRAPCPLRPLAHGPWPMAHGPAGVAAALEPRAHSPAGYQPPPPGLTMPYRANRKYPYRLK